jgi:hypothetical protein
MPHSTQLSIFLIETLVESFFAFFALDDDASSTGSDGCKHILRLVEHVMVVPMTRNDNFVMALGGAPNNSFDLHRY